MTDRHAAARSDTGKVRERNEDRWLIRRRRGVLLLAVADGVGGEAGGEHASESAVGTLAERFYTALASQDLRAALTSAIREANDAVVRGAGERGERSATTLVACAVRGREATIANVGDSRAYLVRGRSARQLTTDHSGARPNEVTRFLGDERGVQPDVFVETLRAGDRLLLCSDGLTRHVTDEELASRVRGGDPWSAAGGLVELANERGGEDNVTVLVYRVRGSPLAGALVLAALLALLIALAAVALPAGALPAP